MSAAPRRVHSVVAAWFQTVGYDSCPLSHRLELRLKSMLYTLAVVLVVLWALGFLAFHVGGGLIHLLLVIAIVAVLLRVIQGRRPI